jgi:hypothetical protein
VIQAKQRPDGQHRTNRGCPWIAECTVDGVGYAASSRSGASYALARVLVAAGVPDQPMHLTSQGLRGETRLPSIHVMAGFTMAESATQPVHKVRWSPMPDQDAQRAMRDARQMRGTGGPGGGIAAGERGPLAASGNSSELIEV